MWGRYFSSFAISTLSLEETHQRSNRWWLWVSHCAGNLNSPCRRVWRREIHFFLLLIRFCGSQSPSWFFLWHVVGWFNKMTTGKWRQAANCGVVWTRPVDHSSCVEENESSLPRPTCNLRLSLVWQFILCPWRDVTTGWRARASFSSNET